MSVIERSVRKDVRRNRALLLESADALIRTNGIELSLNAVAHHAGVGVGTVYRHFADREALLRALLEERIGRVAAIMTSHLTDDDPVEAVRAIVMELGQMQSDDRSVWELLCSASEDERRHTVQDRLLPIVHEIVGRATATGRIRPGFNANDLPVLLWTAGALNAYLGGVSNTAWRRYVQALLDGMLREDDPPLAEPALTSEDIGAAMRAWRPGGLRRT